jgi:WD40 repeat protein
MGNRPHRDEGEGEAGFPGLSFTRYNDYIYRAAFNERGDRLLSCGYGGNIIVWNVDSGQQLFAERLPGVANYADFAPDGTRIAVAGGDGVVHLLDVPAAAR